jgi:hypothetical protein
MIKQWQEIGEGGDWEFCETDDWFRYCNSSPEHNTRLVPKGTEVYNGQFEVKEKV